MERKQIAQQLFQNIQQSVRVEPIFSLRNLSLFKPNVLKEFCNRKQVNFKPLIELMKKIGFKEPERCIYFCDNILNPVFLFDGKYAQFIDVPSENIELNIEGLKEGKIDFHNIDNFHAMRWYGFLENQKKAHQLFDDGEWEEYFARLDKPFLLSLFNLFEKNIPMEKRYEIYVEIYVRSEFNFYIYPLTRFKNLFKTSGFHSADRMERLSYLPRGEKIMVYRGQNTSRTPYSQAISWTLDPGVAVRFANTKENGEVKFIEINKKYILDYLTEREECEVLILPNHVKNAKSMPIEQFVDEHKLIVGELEDAENK